MKRAYRFFISATAEHLTVEYRLDIRLLLSFRSTSFDRPRFGALHATVLPLDRGSIYKTEPHSKNGICRRALDCSCTHNLLLRAIETLDLASQHFPVLHLFKTSLSIYLKPFSSRGVESGSVSDAEVVICSYNLEGKRPQLLGDLVERRHPSLLLIRNIPQDLLVLRVMDDEKCFNLFSAFCGNYSEYSLHLY